MDSPTARHRCRTHARPGPHTRRRGPGGSRLPAHTHGGVREIHRLRSRERRRRRQDPRLGSLDQSGPRRHHHQPGAAHGHLTNHDQPQLVHATPTSRRAAHLARSHPGRNDRPDRAARRRIPARLRFLRRRRSGEAGRQPALPAAGDQLREVVHPGRTDHRHAAPSRHRDPVQRCRADPPHHRPHLLGRRQPLPPSPGPVAPQTRMEEALDRRRPRTVLDQHGQARRHRAAGHHDGRTRRLRFRPQRSRLHAHAGPDGPRRGGQGRLSDLRRAGEAA